MNPTRQNIYAALNGETPEKTPLSIYDWLVNQSEVPFEEWKPLFAMGLGYTSHVPTVEHKRHGIEHQYETRQEGDRHYDLHRIMTPVGSIQQVRVNGWHYEDWVKSPQDYNTLQWIIEHTELIARPEWMLEREEQVGQYGIVLIHASRSPAMQILVDWAGAERFCMDIAEEMDELLALYEAMRKQFLEETRLVAETPGRFVKWLENLTVSNLGPRRYQKMLMNIYEEAVPILEAAGKRVMVHYDGALQNISQLIAKAPFHIIESLTEPPEGNMTYDACRAAWADKAFWANINLEHYYLPKEELKQVVRQKRERAGKRGLAFELSEDLPTNWRESIPIVLETLLEMD